MTLEEMLKINDALSKRATPCDMPDREENVTEYYSKSRKEWINILDIDIIHFVRIMKKECEVRWKEVDYDEV